MSDIASLFQNGQLADALSAAKDAVRKSPQEAGPRVALFGMFAVAGEIERASDQLDVAARLDASPQMVQFALLYRQALTAESRRLAVFRGEQEPVFVGEPPDWCAAFLAALKEDAAGNHAAAADMRAQALESVDANPGICNGEHRFDWLMDGDSRLGPLLEVVLQGVYRWVPFGKIKAIDNPQPDSPRSHVWAPVKIHWQEGGYSDALIPARYPALGEGISDNHRMARQTDWAEPAEGSFHGQGQRELLGAEQAFALLDVRKLEFDMVADSNE